MTARRSTAILLLVLALAAALRFYRIDAQSLWSDEGSSVAQALRDVPAIAANAALDIHPPLYYILLHFWVMPFGTSEAGVRSLSAALGVVLVALCYLLAGTLWDERTGFLAAFLAAVNPFQVYYAQEARMYMLMALLGAVCVYATLKALQRRRTPSPRRSEGSSGGRSKGALSGLWPWYALYAPAAVLGLYTHYFFPIVLLVCNAVFMIDVLFRKGQEASDREQAKAAIALWLVVQAVVLLCFLPWLPTAIRQITTWPAGAFTFTAADAPVVVLRALNEGLSAPRDDGIWLLLSALLLLAGALPLHRPPAETRSTVHPSLVILLYLLAPFAAMYALALFKDTFLKFMLVASPPFVLLAANGIEQAASLNWQRVRAQGQRAGNIARAPIAADQPEPAAGRKSRIPDALLLLGALLVAAPSALSLQNYYYDPQFARDDYRSIAHTIDALGREGDAIILDAPGQQEIFSYYYHGKLPVYPLPRRRPPDTAATQSELQPLAAGQGRLFVVLWATGESDPEGVVESWLDAHAFKATDNWYGNVRLAIYAGQRVASQVQTPLDLRWGDAIRLQGYTLGAAAIDAGDVLPLTLFWQTDRPLAQRYKVFVHLLDPRGFVIAQRDAEPVGGSRPTSGWTPGETIVDPYGLFVPFGTPPLSYQIEIGLYDPNSGVRLNDAAGADHLLLGPVTVRATTSVQAVPGMLPLSVPASNGLTLLGYQAGKVGFEGQRDAVFHAGDALHLTLFWRKTQAAATDGAYRLQVGALVKQTTPTDGLYPVAQWRDGEVVRDDQVIALPADWHAGTYQISIDGHAISQVAVQ